MNEFFQRQEKQRAVLEQVATVERRGGAGAAFPAGVAAGFRWFRTDLGLDFAYDSTYWLSQELQADFTPYTRTVVPYTGAGVAALLIAPMRTDFDIYVTLAKVYIDVLTTNNGTNYWSLRLHTSGGSTPWSFDTSANSAGVAIAKSSAINTSYPGNEYFSYDVVSKTGAPGSLAFNGTFWYRLRIT